MHLKGIRPYYIGLAVIGGFTVIMLFVVLILAASGRQDAVTAQKATEIADKLNNYTADGSNVPSSLDSVGIKNVPSTITYNKLSNTAYKFCATYRSDGNNLSVTGVEQSLSQLQTAPSVSSRLDASTNLNTTDSTYLDTSTHHKGQNCQTISTDGGVYTNTGGGSGGSQTSDPCVYPGDSASSDAFKKYEDCENNYYNSITPDPTPVTNTPPTTKT